MMQPANFLDLMIARFRHRWMTDRQYRAAMSGLIGLVTLIGMCACMGVVSAMANGALVGTGLSQGANKQQVSSGDNGQVIVQGVPQFPTQTIPTWAVPPTPASNPIPVSQTPAPTPTSPPTPTPAPTDTPCVSNCGGGGGGGGGGTLTISASPNPFIGCSGGSACDQLIIHTSVPNNGINIIMTWCNGATILSYPAVLQTDGGGNLNWAFSGPSESGGTATGTVQAQSGASAPISVPCK